jgi:hypothetical protein
MAAAMRSGSALVVGLMTATARRNGAAGCVVGRGRMHGMAAA